MADYTLKDLTEILSCCERTLKTYIYEGRLEAHKVGRRWEVSEEALQRFKEGLKTEKLTPKDYKIFREIEDRQYNGVFSCRWEDFQKITDTCAHPLEKALNRLRTIPVTIGVHTRPLIEEFTVKNAEELSVKLSDFTGVDFGKITYNQLTAEN